MSELIFVIWPKQEIFTWKEWSHLLGVGLMDSGPKMPALMLSLCKGIADMDLIRKPINFNLPITLKSQIKKFISPTLSPIPFPI